MFQLLLKFIFELEHCLDKPFVELRGFFTMQSFGDKLKPYLPNSNIIRGKTSLATSNHNQNIVYSIEANGYIILFLNKSYEQSRIIHKSIGLLSISHHLDCPLVSELDFP